MKKKIRNLILSLVLVFPLLSCNKDEEAAPITSATLNGVKISYFMYQIQGLEEHADIDLLSASKYDMLIVEAGFNIKDDPYDVSYMINQLKTKPNGDKRLLLAYIDIGQAEDWRTYWEEDWIAPTETQVGFPNFLITLDPDGWSGNYPVAYWNTEWQDIWLSNNGIIKKIANYGFDGVYLDWVEAYDDEKIHALAISNGKNPESEMMSFMDNIRDTGKEINPNFLIVPQNAPYLIDSNTNRYLAIIDALAVEDTWFYGEGDADWNSNQAGDLSGGERHADDYSTNNRIKQNKKYSEHGIPVFTVDYCISDDNANFVYNESRKKGFIPLVTRVSLSKITKTPPFTND
jgi:cysteinyl-tRNA synthetase